MKRNALESGLLGRSMVAPSDRLNLGNALAQGVVKVFDGPAARQLRRQLLDDQPNSLCRACALHRGTF